MTPLEALNKLLFDKSLDIIPSVEEETQFFGIIETALKRLEEIDNGAYVPVHINRYNELCDKEEALEIIKKNVKVYGERFAPLGKIEIEHIYLDMEKYVSQKKNTNY